MAIRVIREIGDDILEKQCKAVPRDDASHENTDRRYA